MGPSRGRLEQLLRQADRLREAVLDRGEASSVVMRRAAFDGVPAEALLAGFVIRVREHADRICDADVAALRDHGLSDDAIFEVTVAAALGAAQRRLDAGLTLLTSTPSR